MISFKPSGKNGTEVRKNVDHIVKSLRKSHPQKVQHNAISYGYGDFKNDKEGKLGPTTGYVLAKKGHEDTVKKHIQSYGAKIVEEVEQVDEISQKLHDTRKSMKEDVNPYYELDEARGRPAGAATLAKRAAAAAKPRDDDDEGEHYDADSGVEADQHIHVQLKKAADSDQKPFEVSFKNGKKHAVSQKVAKDILGATERLKPEHRKNVHDEIHQSYDNLMSVHRLVAGR